MVQSPTFHSFSRLPSELQIAILTSATTPCFKPRSSLRKHETTCETSRLARLVAVEAWEEDFEGHHLHWHFDELDDEKLVVGKAEMLGILDEMIAETRGRMKT